ncbi:hypothetical protein D9601_17950 [Sphingomonas sp. MA1305]|uniref:hypothetical protein n=1 Tax=Sphingomonas sp. MA1305 TaxID=2479204 RepID=UPI0018DF97D3|nr:hypothetical protein [Sphingomonas sp. MA1305]MBI0477235.1 hypothetical protein [Sphingomonas sp. MA1305]
MIYIAYAVLACILFCIMPVRAAIVATYVGGWLVLPVGSYAAYRSGFTIELIGTMLPAPAMLLNKSWVVAIVPLVLATIRAPRAWLAWRPGPIDLPVLIFCLWPLPAGIAAAAPSPAPIVACAYLMAIWAAPWLLARIYLDDAAGRIALAKALSFGALAIAPFALAEGIAGPFLYPLVYGPHPYIADGVDRYIGFRPLLMFEDGNQYGIFVALAALCAIALWRQGGNRVQAVHAVIVTGLAILSQSAGAILLMLAGAFVLLAPVRTRDLRRAAIAVAALCVIVAPLYVSGALPIERLVRHTAPGQKLLAVVRATGRGSIAWRVSQDQKVAGLIRQHPVVGTSRWDWWRPSQTRPWNLALLIVGQFGVIAFGLAAWILGYGSIRLLARRDRYGIVEQGLALVTMLAALDALLNAFVFVPALLAAGAIAAGRRPLTAKRRDPQRAR